MARKGRALGVILKELFEDAIPDKRTFKDLEVSSDSGADGAVDLDFSGELAYTNDGRLALAFDDADLTPADGTADITSERVHSVAGPIAVHARLNWHFNSDGKRGWFGNR